MRYFAVLTVMFAMAMPLHAQDRPETRRLQPFLDVVQQADPQRRLFAIGNMTPEMILGMGIDRVSQRMGAIGDQLGSHELESVDVSGSQVFATLRLSDNRGSAQMVLMVGPAPHFQIASFELMMGAAPERTPAPIPEPVLTPEPEPEPQPQPQLQPQPQPQPEAQPQPQPQPEAAMSPESVALVERRLIPLLENLQQPTLVRRNFVEENMTPSVIEQVGVDGLAEAMARLSEQLGAFRVTGVTHTSGYLRARVELIDRGTTMALVLPLGPAPDYLIDGLMLAADSSAMATVPEATEETLTEVLSEFVNGQAADGFAGAVLVAKGGEVAYAGAFGPADPDGLDINTMLVPFNIGPITELLTTVMALSLAEEEVLDLEAAIGSYLPDLPQEALREAQVGDLLTHVSGLGPLVAGSPDSLDSLQAYVAAVRRMEPTASPGMEFQHSEANTVLLGAVAERASGESYAALMREHVYQPAGMTGSGHFNRSEVHSCCAIGIMSDGSANLQALPQLGSPGAGSYATAIDLWRFSNALLQGDLLSTGTFLRATSPAIIPVPNVAIGLGISIFDDEGETYIGATGRAPGMGADLAIYPASGYIVVVLSNTDGGARPLAIQLRRIIRPLMGEE